MATKRNPGVVYSGKVTGKMRPFPKSKGCTPGLRRVIKQMVVLIGGPMNSHRLALADGSCTLPIAMNGETGRYVQGQSRYELVWQAA